MRLFSVAVCTGVAVALLAGCSGTGSSPSNSSIMPGGASKISHLGHHGTPLMAAIPKFLHAPRKGHLIWNAAAAKGQYTQEFFATSNNVLGYPKNNSGNGPSTCSESTGTNVNGIGVDPAGNLIVPNAFGGVQVYSGPGQCGPLMATIPDSLGQAADGASRNAASGTIVVGHANGTVAACTVSGTSGTCNQLTAPNLALGFTQVAMDGAGNCYANGFDTISGLPSLWYWTGCSGTGIEDTGYSASATGGLDVDNQGNVVAVAQGAPSTVTVYSGCATGACTILTGPTNLNGSGDAVYCHLGKQNERYACGDASTGSVDVYSYLPTRTPTYMYSYNNGLTSSLIVEVGLFAPPSRK